MPNNSYNSQKFKKMPMIFSILFLTLSSLAFFFLYKEINNNKKIGELAQTEWQNEANRRDAIKLLERSIKAISEEKTLLESHFAQSSNVVPFLNSIERLAAKANAKSEVSSIDLKDKKELIVALKASGSFESIYKFLTLLENSPYELEFISVKITRLNVNTSLNKNVTNPQWDAIFKIKLLSFIP